VLQTKLNYLQVCDIKLAQTLIPVEHIKLNDQPFALQYIYTEFRQEEKQQSKRIQIWNSFVLKMKMMIILRSAATMNNVNHRVLGVAVAIAPAGEERTTSTRLP
jgi:hypothetical protein